MQCLPLCLLLLLETVTRLDLQRGTLKEPHPFVASIVDCARYYQAEPALCCMAP